jgi:hypothetical protein
VRKIGLAHIAIAAVEEGVGAGVASQHRPAGAKVEGVVVAAAHPNQHHATTTSTSPPPHRHSNIRPRAEEVEPQVVQQPEPASNLATARVVVGHACRTRKRRGGGH